MTIDEVQDHFKLHRSNRLPLTPIASQPSEQASQDPIPTSPSTDDTLSTSAASSPPSSLPLSTPPPPSPASLDSQTLPDTQNPMSPSAPSPPSFSPPHEANAELMRRFLDACGNSPVPTAPTSPVNPTTPSPAIPPLMANTITTPTPDLSSTLAPAPTTINRRPVIPRPRAADFFDLPPPVLEDLPESENVTTPPPRPCTLPPSNPPNLTPAPTIQSPIGEDPSTASFPSSQTTTSLHDFRERYNLEFDEDMDFHDFQRLTQQFTADAVNLARTVSSQQRPCPAQHRPDRPSARPPIDRRRPLSSDSSAAKRLQHLYRVSKKRAAWKIFGDESPGYNGTLDDATEYI